ncbi:MAG TPA: aminotransferase class IV [Solirubrobacterales bacterium]|nr:aminotransferase class IV [Solirubrobacterales bacterium]
MTTGFTEMASVDGGIGPTAEATIGLKDDGLYRGDGAFEVIRIYDGRPFALDDHLARLERSAAALRLEFDRAALGAEIAALLDAAGPIDGQLRLIVTRGGRRIAATENVPAHGETIRIASVTYQPTVILDGVKSLSYGANMQATRLAKEKGAEEALLVRPDGVVLEPPTSSIFWVADGALRTTALGEGVLASITRDRLLKAIPGIEEGTWTLEEVKGAEEAFLASTTREVQAVAAIDGVALPAAPGPRTREAQEVFAAARDRELGAAQT